MTRLSATGSSPSWQRGSVEIGMSTAKLRAEVEKLKPQIASLTQGPSSVFRVIEPELMPDDSPSSLFIAASFIAAS
jgi:hypothetical protein